MTLPARFRQAYSRRIPAYAGMTVLLFLLSLPSISAAAGPAAQQKARQNYILNCQGCHLPDGSGSKGAVPPLNGFVGNFLQVPGGREFIAQVPGVAGAPISDPELAAVINWMLQNFSPKQLPKNFQPYTAAEVGELRKSPIIDVKPARTRLIQKIEALKDQ